MPFRELQEARGLASNPWPLGCETRQWSPLSDYGPQATVAWKVGEHTSNLGLLRRQDHQLNL